VTAAVPDDLRAEVVDALRRAGARFALLHGSRARRTHRPDSDVDVAAWWSSSAPAAFDVPLPAGVDLVVLDDEVPLELAGRIARDGVLLFDDDPPARVRWVATTRKIYADEQPRMDRSHREFVESLLRRGR
jgi:predicted nucleotidyltransferase